MSEVFSHDMASNVKFHFNAKKNVLEGQTVFGVFDIRYDPAKLSYVVDVPKECHDHCHGKERELSTLEQCHRLIAEMVECRLKDSIAVAPPKKDK